MQLTAIERKPVIIDTTPIFGEMTPQPRIHITPLTWQQRGKIMNEATDIRVVEHPAKAGEFLPAELLNKWKLPKLYIKAAVVAIEHIELADGRPVDANKSADMDELLSLLPSAAILWLHQQILSISDAADAQQAEQIAAARKN